ncbi:MAG: hypothetical protein QNJ68_20840 [Microcoleaceae cyanobacterium MO_207.B10]|nr:hypothetical protein [Microcoleaceae cyanobacterium MO_207.B10]
MKIKTKLHTDAVKEALLSLSDIELYNTIDSWLDRIIEQSGETELLDEMKFALGYELESGESFQSYRNWDELIYAEPDCEDVYLIAPSPLKLRRHIDRMDSNSVYHNLIYVAGKALGKEIGWPPNAFCDGYKFMENLVTKIRNNQPSKEQNNCAESFRVMTPNLYNEQFFQVSEHWRTYSGGKVTEFVVLTSN